MNKIKGEWWTSVRHERGDPSAGGAADPWASFPESQAKAERSERLTSFQGERLDHCRHDCCLLETGGEREREGEREAAASEGERESARAGSGFIYLHPHVFTCFTHTCAHRNGRGGG